MNRLGLRLLALFLASASGTYAGPGDPSVDITDWARGVVSSATPDNVSEIQSPYQVLEIIKEYSQIQNEKFNAALKEIFLEAVKTNYSGSIDREEYLEALKQVLRGIQEKEHRFSKEDSIAILRIGLKIAFRYEFSLQEWDLFKEDFFKRLTATPIEGKPIKERIEGFWDTVSLASRDFFARRSNIDETQVDRLSRQLVDRVQRLNSVLTKHSPKDSLFFLSLQITQLLKYEGFDSENWPAFSHAISQKFTELARIKTKDFQMEADTGKLRQNLGDWLSVRFDMVFEGGDYHLVTIAQKDLEAPMIVVINPPHSLDDGGLNPKSYELRKLVWNLHTDAIVFDFGAQLKPIYVYKHEPWWNPIRYLTDIRGAYKNPSSGTWALGAASFFVNGGIRAGLLASAAAGARALNPDNPAVHYDWTAIGVFSGYMFFCAAWNKFYDNVMSLFPGTMSETVMKILVSLPVTYAFLELTTSPQAFDQITLGIPLTDLSTQIHLPAQIPGVAATLALTVAASSGDKFVSTYVRRIIRFLVKEGIIHGEWSIKSGHLNPVLWARWIRRESSNDFEIKEADLVFGSKLVKLDDSQIQEISQKLNLGPSETLENILSKLSREKVEADQGGFEVPESDLSFEDAEELLNSNRNRILERHEKRPAQEEELPIFGSRIALHAPKDVVVRELQGYGHNFVNSVTQTISPALGLLTMGGVGFVSNHLTLRYAKRKLQKYTAENNTAMIDFYQTEIRKIERDFLLIPGLLPKLKSLAGVCRSLVSSLVSK